MTLFAVNVSQRAISYISIGHGLGWFVSQQAYLVSAYCTVWYGMYHSRAYLVSAYSTVWYGMYLSGAYLVSPPLYLTPLYICPPSTPPLHTYTSSSKAPPSSPSTSPTQIHQFLPPTGGYISVKKSAKKSWQELFFNFELFAVFCSSESLHGGYCGLVLVWLNWTSSSMYSGPAGWSYRYRMTFPIYPQPTRQVGLEEHVVLQIICNFFWKNFIMVMLSQ